MNKFALGAILAAQGTTASVVYNALDDPRCHESPNRPVLEPTPSPTPLPPDGHYRVFEDTNPPTLPKCPGMVSGMVIVDLDDSNFEPITVVDGMYLNLATLPENFSIEAEAESGPIDFMVDGNHVHQDSDAPFYFKGGHPFYELEVSGTYTISARAASETDGDACELTVTVEYGNPDGLCEGVITKFALFDTQTQDLVPGYENLADRQDLDLAYLPDTLSIVAFHNGRAGDEVEFYLDGALFNRVDGISDTSPDTYVPMTTVSGAGVDEMSELRTTGSYVIKAKMKNAMGAMEHEGCEITIMVDSDWICHNEIVGFSLIKAGTDEVVAGYDHMAGNRVLDLADFSDQAFPSGLTLRANKKHVQRHGVKFYLRDRHLRGEGAPPYGMAGKSIDGDEVTFHPSEILATPGIHHIGAIGANPEGRKYIRGDMCWLDLTVIDSRIPDPPLVPPETELELIEHPEDGDCSARLVAPVTGGNLMYMTKPVAVEEVVTNDIVRFTVSNTLLSSDMDWMTTAFVTESGVEVCDKVDNVPMDQTTGHIYEAKCHDGFAYADVFFHSSTFPADQSSADTSLLPAGCKGADGEVVARFTFVFTCDCDNEVPDEIVGGIPKNPKMCTGPVGHTWGDPHVGPYDGGQWDCQGQGEFVFTKATMPERDYDFEVRARYWKFDFFDRPYTWNTGIAVKTDVEMQFAIGEEALPTSTMFADLPLNFYVNGEPRLLSQGSGDHRLEVTVSGYDVDFFFVSIGVNIRVFIRPNSVSGHNTPIPGSLSTFVCLPDDTEGMTNFVGLLGVPNGDKSDDFMDQNGNTLTGVNHFDYCRAEWCIRNEDESFFIHDPAFPFSHYERCDAPQRGEERRDLQGEEPFDPSTVSDRIKEICKGCEGTDMYDSCLYDGSSVDNGEIQAFWGVDVCNKRNEIGRMQKYKIHRQEVGGWSSNWRDRDRADGEVDEDPEWCVDQCIKGDKIYLPAGSLDETNTLDNKWDCIPKDGVSDGTKICCTKLVRVEGKCVPPAVAPGRRLAEEEFVLVRPDLPENREILPYSQGEL